MGKLQFLIIHCTATPEKTEVTAATIRKWHMSPPPQGRGWAHVGYADMIHLNGIVENLVKYNHDDKVDAWEITNGAMGMNSKSRHVVYVGGMDEEGRYACDTRTKEQLLAMTNYIKQTIAFHPDIKIAGHNQFAQKACPSFDVPKWLKGIGIPDKNIYSEWPKSSI